MILTALPPTGIHGNHICVYPPAIPETEEKCAMTRLTKNITRHIRKQNAAFQAARKSGKPDKHSKFKKLHNEVVKLMRNAKSSYFQRLAKP